jgi:hypothetical protein
MSIHDFHSKLTSGKEEGKLFKALRKLNSLESTLAYAEQEPAYWNEWSADSGSPASFSQAALAKA